MENTSETLTLSNIHSDVCVDSGCTDQKLKLEIDQMISKRKRKNKQEFVSDKSTSNKHLSKSTHVESDSESEDSDNDHSDKDESVEILERMKHRTTSSSVAKHLSTSSLAHDWKNEKKSNKVCDINNNRQKHHHKNIESNESKDSEQDQKIATIDKRYNKISQVTRDTRGDVLKILLILQKLIDDSRTQKQKVAKLEIKLKELDEKIDNQTQSIHYLKKSNTSGTSGMSGSGTFASSNDNRRASDNSDFHVQSSTDRDHHGGNSREYELKFDRFKQEVNTEIIKINVALATSNTNFDEQIGSVREQLAMLFGGSIKNRGGKCC